MTMNSNNIPKGVKFATLCMISPLIASTIGKIDNDCLDITGLGLCGVLSTGEAYQSVGYLARSSIRLIQLNLSFGVILFCIEYFK